MRGRDMGAQNVPHTSTAFPNIPFCLIGNTWRYCRGKKEARTAIWLSALFNRGGIRFGGGLKAVRSKGAKIHPRPSFLLFRWVGRLSPPVCLFDKFRKQREGGTAYTARPPVLDYLLVVFTKWTWPQSACHAPFLYGKRGNILKSYCASR